MALRNPMDEATSRLRQVHLDATRVLCVALLCNEPKDDAAINQRCRPVRACLQALSELSYRRPLSCPMSGDVQEHQVLDLRESIAPRRGCAEALELCDVEAEVREGYQLRPGKQGGSSFGYWAADLYHAVIFRRPEECT